MPCISNVTERRASLKVPVTLMASEALTARLTFSPSLKQTPSRPSMTKIGVHSCAPCVSRPMGTVNDSVAVMVFIAPGHGVL